MGKRTKHLSEGEAFGLKLLQSVREMKAGQAACITMVESNAVALARKCTGLSQDQFAQAIGISARTLQEWEQGGRVPRGAARTLIRIATRHPEVLLEAINLGN